MFALKMQVLREKLHIFFLLRQGLEVAQHNLSTATNITATTPPGTAPPSWPIEEEMADSEKPTSRIFQCR